MALRVLHHQVDAAQMLWLLGPGLKLQQLRPLVLAHGRVLAHHKVVL